MVVKTKKIMVLESLKQVLALPETQDSLCKTLELALKTTRGALNPNLDAALKLKKTDLYKTLHRSFTDIALTKMDDDSFTSDEIILVMNDLFHGQTEF